MKARDYENVKGMLSSNKGLDYLEILFEMASLGYDIQYELLNSKDFGVPQNRERVYTLGHLRTRGERKVFPVRSDGRDATNASGTDEDLMWADCGVGHKWTERSSITPPLRSQGGGNAPGIAIISKTGKIKQGNTDRQYASCLTAGAHSGGNHSDMDLVVVPRACLTPDRVEKRQNGRRFKDPGDQMFTLTKQDIHGILFTQKKVTQKTDIANTLTARNPSTSRGKFTPITGITDGQYIRRLTPRECMRLQGVPDYITDKLIDAGISDTQLYRAAGDACTVNVIYEIARAMAEQWAGNALTDSNENTCVSCGASIPEGLMVCPTCERGEITKHGNAIQKQGIH